MGLNSTAVGDVMFTADELLLLQEAMSRRVRDLIKRKYNFDDETLDGIANTDPSFAGKYSEWIAVQVHNGVAVPDEEIKRWLEGFERAIKSPKYTGERNLNNMSIIDLKRAVEDFQNRDDRLAAERKKRYNQYMSSTMILADGEVTVHKITNLEQSMSLCRNTTWCIRNSEAFENYHIGEQNPFYVFMVHGYPYVGALPSAGQFRDLENESINTSKLRVLTPTILKLQKMGIHFGLKGDF